MINAPNASLQHGIILRPLLLTYSNGTTNSTVKNVMEKAYAARRVLSSVDGYSADRESNSDQGGSISSASGGKRRCDEINMKLKVKSIREKILEEKFEAASALEDIKRANRPFKLPKIGVNTCFMGGIDLTQVQHFVSSEYPLTVKNIHEVPHCTDWTTTVARINAIFAAGVPFYSQCATETGVKLTNRDGELGSPIASELGNTVSASKPQSPIQVVA